MEVDEEKVEDMVLALLYLTTFKDRTRLRAWKGHNWDALNRLHQKGYISDPVTKAKSVLLTEVGAERSQDSLLWGSSYRRARRLARLPCAVPSGAAPTQ